MSVEKVDFPATTPATTPRLAMIIATATKKFGSGMMTETS